MFSSYFGLWKGCALFQNVLAVVHLQDLIYSFEIRSLHKLGISGITDNELLWLEASGIKKTLLHKNIIFLYRIETCSEEAQLAKKKKFSKITDFSSFFPSSK